MGEYKKIKSLRSFFAATIKCDFQKDWCGFSVSHAENGPSNTGFDWKRQTGDTIKNKHLEGPERGR